MRQRLNKLGNIRFRLMLWYVFFLAITILSFALYLQLQLQNSLNTQLDDGLQVAASQLLVTIDDTADTPVFRPISDSVVAQLDQSRFAVRLIDKQGNVTAAVGDFPKLSASLPTQAGFETIGYDNTSWRIYTQLIETQSKEREVWLQTAQSINIIDEIRSNLLRPILISLPLALIAAAWGGMFMANRALRPVDAITRTVQALNATDLTRRIDYQGPADELGRLTWTLNSMLDRLQSAFDTERQFTADASHELRTPLTAIKGQIGVTLNRQRTVEDYETTLYQIQHETDRLIHLTNGLLFLARLDALPQYWQAESINLSDLLEVVAEQVHPLAAAKQITLHTHIPRMLSVSGVPDHLIQLFLNLLDNAIKYTPFNGQIIFSAQQADNEVLVSVQDNGTGIAPEHLSHLFKRFYRVERERSSKTGGTGLGLAIAYQIAREHDGNIKVESSLGNGTTFIVSLPLSSTVQK